MRNTATLRRPAREASLDLYGVIYPAPNVPSVRGFRFSAPKMALSKRWGKRMAILEGKIKGAMSA